MEHLTEKQKLCLKCGQCCKKMVIPLIQPVISNKIEEFYKARGFEIIKYKGMNFVKFDFTCPHLQKDNKCDMYENRPDACKSHKGSSDPFLKDECLWNRKDNKNE